MSRGRLLLAVAALLLLGAAWPAVGGAVPRAGGAVELRDTAPPYRWARPIAARLVRSGEWASLARVDLGAPAPRRALAHALTLVTGVPAAAPAAPRAPVSARGAQRAFVLALGLDQERRGLERLATADGRRFAMPRDAGSAVLARELGMVHNYPFADERLERSGDEPIRWADLLGMLSAARRVDGADRARLSAYRTITLPAMTPAQRAVAQAAISQIGSVYVWGGDWPTAASPWYRQAHGGFDCSGLVWWAYKAYGPSAARGLGTGIYGRTADDMAWERPGQRVPLSALRAGDLVFYGDRGRRARRGDISHMSIALGGGWMIQSAGSRAGVSITPMRSYWPSGAAFGRRIPALAK